MANSASNLKRYLQCCLIFGFLLTPLLTPLPTSALALAETAKTTPEEQVKIAEEAFDKADIISAMKHYRKAAEAGYGPAMTRLAYLLDKSEANEEAIEWFKKAVKLGEAEAQFELARMYAYGEGVQPDKKMALALFSQSAKQKFAPAIRALALAYENGGLDLRIDYELTQHWLKRGQLVNDYWSINRLAQAYREGDLGLRINHKKAKLLEQQLEPLKKQGKQ